MARLMATQLEMFWQSHRQMMVPYLHFMEVQNGPNPLTAAEIRRLAEKHPERWGQFLGIAERMEKENG